MVLCPGTNIKTNPNAMLAGRKNTIFTIVVKTKDSGFFWEGLEQELDQVGSLNKKIGYNINVLQLTACLVVKPITVGNFAFLFNCTPVGRTSDSTTVPT